MFTLYKKYLQKSRPLSYLTIHNLIIQIASLTLTFCDIFSYIQGDQLYMVVCFWYPVKSYLSSVRVHYTRKATFYKKNTAMFIWSGCNCLDPATAVYTPWYYTCIDYRYTSIIYRNKE